MRRDDDITLRIVPVQTRSLFVMGAEQKQARQDRVEFGRGKRREQRINRLLARGGGLCRHGSNQVQGFWPHRTLGQPIKISCKTRGFLRAQRQGHGGDPDFAVPEL